MFRPIITENIGSYCIKQLHNNAWSAVYVDLLVIVRVVICDTVSGKLKQRVIWRCSRYR